MIQSPDRELRVLSLTTFLRGKGIKKLAKFIGEYGRERKWLGKPKKKRCLLNTKVIDMTPPAERNDRIFVVYNDKWVVHIGYTLAINRPRMYKGRKGLLMYICHGCAFSKPVYIISRKKQKDENKNSRIVSTLDISTFGSASQE